jgi:hypothetical protein
LNSLVHPPAGVPEQAVASCSSARRSSGPSGTGGSAADHRLTATCAAAMTIRRHRRRPLPELQGEDHRYAETIRRYLDQDKPVVNSEFGHGPYRGDRPGHMEFGEVDTGSLALHRIPLAGRLVRTRLKKGSHLRDGGWLQSRQR